MSFKRQQEDKSNELSYLYLEAIRKIRIINISPQDLPYSDPMYRKFLDKHCYSLRVARFGFIFMGRTIMQEKGSSGVGTVQKENFYWTILNHRYQYILFIYLLFQV